MPRFSRRPRGSDALLVAGKASEHRNLVVLVQGHAINGRSRASWHDTAFHSRCALNVTSRVVPNASDFACQISLLVRICCPRSATLGCGAWRNSLRGRQSLANCLSRCSRGNACQPRVRGTLLPPRCHSATLSVHVRSQCCPLF